MDLNGGVVIVTGSATGVGAASAKLLASKGCNVVINYTKSETEAKQTAAECEAFGVETTLCRADVSVDADCRRMAEADRQTNSILYLDADEKRAHDKVWEKRGKMASRIRKLLRDIDGEVAVIIEGGAMDDEEEART